MAESHLAPFAPGNAKNTILHLVARAFGIPVNNAPVSDVSARRGEPVPYSRDSDPMARLSWRNMQQRQNPLFDYEEKPFYGMMLNSDDNIVVGQGNGSVQLESLQDSSWTNRRAENRDKQAETIAHIMQGGLLGTGSSDHIPRLRQIPWSADVKDRKTAGLYGSYRPELSTGDNILLPMSRDRIPVPVHKPVFARPDRFPPARSSGTVRYVSPAAIEKIKEWEKLETKAYHDQGNVWTIGYGHTGRSGGVVPYEGMRITPEHAGKLLADDLNVAAKDVQNLVKVPLNDNQYAALVAFFLNMGNKDSTRKSTFLRELNAGDYSAIEREFPKWVWYTDTKDKKSKKSDGLIDRRNKEIQLWKTPVN